MAIGFLFSALAGLFLSAFTSATVLPGTSEIVLTGLISQTEIPIWLLVTVASIGNILGSIINWGLGLFANRFRGRKFFPASDEQLERAEIWYKKYGYWSLLASSFPIFGDPLTVVAGVMREPFWRFFLLVTIAKTGRYILVAAGLMQLLR